MGADCCSSHASPRPTRDPLASALGSDSDGLAHLTAADKKKLDQVAAYLANTKRSQVKLRQGIFNGSRVSYFRGKHAVAALQLAHAHPLLLTPPPPVDHVSDDEDGHPHNIHHHHDHSAAHCPQPSLDDQIQYTLDTMVLLGMLVLVDKPAPKSKHLQLTALQQFDPAEYLVLAHVPTSATHMLASVGLVLVVLAGVMFPLWPESLRQGVVYISYALLALIGALFVLAIIRLILYLALLVVGKPGWLFPNLFADVGILESFVPVWEWEAPAAAAAPKAAAAAAKPKAE